MTQRVPITVAHGDGIGPEIMDATLRILEAAGARIEIDTIQIGEQLYHAGYKSGLRPEDWDTLRRSRVFLKAPITTPQGGGLKSLNVTIRKTLGLYANIRQSVTYHPFVQTRHPGMDVVIIRENEEDLYAGIEHRQTDEVTQCLKLISEPGSEAIIRYAFEYARLNKRKKVTCFSKDNIMKMTDGLFHEVFERVAKEYPEFETEHWIVDIGTARIADTPEDFDVVVMENLYGDIISDITAQISGSVGLGGSANIGHNFAMFEAIHGSAPDIAGKDIANPSGLLLGAVMMLVHIGQGDIAERVHNAWLVTLEQGLHTADIYREGNSKRKVGTKEFCDALIANLGKSPTTLKPVSYAVGEPPVIGEIIQRLPGPAKAKKELHGVDVFFDWRGGTPDELGELLSGLAADNLAIETISNRGVKVWPNGMPETMCTDHWRCRYIAPEGATVSHGDIIGLLQRAADAGLDFVKTEHLYLFDGEPGYSASQGD